MSEPTVRIRRRNVVEDRLVHAKVLCQDALWCMSDPIVDPGWLKSVTVLSRSFCYQDKELWRCMFSCRTAGDLHECGTSGIKVTFVKHEEILIVICKPLNGMRFALWKIPDIAYT